MTLTKDITIEDLVERCPEAIALLRDRGIRCILCGEPTWGTLEQAAAEKGIDVAGIDKIVAELRLLCQSAD